MKFCVTLAAIVLAQGSCWADSGEAKTASHCLRDGKIYSPGAVVLKDGAAYRCVAVYAPELESGAKPGWVQLSDELQPLKK